MERFEVNSLAETKTVAEQLAAQISGPVVIAYFGGLGAGKTTFSRFLCEALGSRDEVTSPTFAMVHEYSGRLPIYHFDMYRVSDYEELYSTGYYDYLGQGVLLIEWSENIQEELPRQYIRLNIEHGESEASRVITIERMGEQI
ncbi:MAG: tRNA (adenosine(37)-N6)-threonylcarbamoyltransferase complex ATPase subunit type 1 TsaE [Clostridia bacterium]|nr:tRNA (adenosine(37)-N6)-threonylcarbamoyltransferase complex ATPase subunit type 1 TsaE [Clostridia bacterium]